MVAHGVGYLCSGLQARPRPAWPDLAWAPGQPRREHGVTGANLGVVACIWSKSQGRGTGRRYQLGPVVHGWLHDKLPTPALRSRKGPRPYLPSRTELLLPLTLCAGNRTRGGYMLHACAAATRAGKGGGDCAWPDRRGRRPSKGKDCFWPACPCGWASGVWCVIATVMASWQAANVLQ